MTKALVRACPAISRNREQRPRSEIRDTIDTIDTIDAIDTIDTIDTIDGLVIRDEIYGELNI